MAQCRTLFRTPLISQTLFELLSFHGTGHVHGRCLPFPVDASWWGPCCLCSHSRSPKGEGLLWHRHSSRGAWCSDLNASWALPPSRAHEAETTPGRVGRPPLVSPLHHCPSCLTRRHRLFCYHQLKELVTGCRLALSKAVLTLWLGWAGSFADLGGGRSVLWPCSLGRPHG